MSRCWRGTVCRAPPPCFEVRLSILLHLRCSSFNLLCRFGPAGVNLNKPLPPLPARPRPPIGPRPPPSPSRPRPLPAHPPQSLPSLQHPQPKPVLRPPSFMNQRPPYVYQSPSLAVIQTQRLQPHWAQSAAPYWKQPLYPHMSVQRELLERVDQRIKLAARAYVRELLQTPMDDLD